MPTSEGPNTKTSGEFTDVELENRDPDNQKLLEDAKALLAHAVDQEREQREKSKDDVDFFNGYQWDEELRNEREMIGRPCLTINRLPTFVDQVVGDQRQNRPQMKVRPIDSGTDFEKAKIMEGLMRHIERQSHADVAYDTAFEYSVVCGLGYWRILTDYIDEKSFDQEILIQKIDNPFSVYCDQMTMRNDFSDMKWAFITEIMTYDTFEERYGDKIPKESVDVGFGDVDQKENINVERVQVAEYFYKEEEKTTLYFLDNGETMDKEEYDEMYVNMPYPEDARPQILRERSSTRTKVMWMKFSGSHILEEPREWAGKYIPIIPCYGKSLWNDGQKFYRGLIRFAKDSQKLYNYWISTATELIALAPKVPWLVTPEMIEGFEHEWESANLEPKPYLPYNNVGGQQPRREMMPQIPAGVISESHNAVEDMKATTGIYDASLGARSNETSGRAILARQREADVGTFAFIDNLSRSMKYQGKILIDLIPKIYDTERAIRILEEDDTEREVVINQRVREEQPGNIENPMIETVMNDMTVGRYDITVDVGPSYTTQRLEAAASMIEFVTAMPNTGAVMADLVAKSMDWPNSDKIAERLKKVLPPGVADDENEDGQPSEQEMMAMQQQQAMMQQQQQMAEMEMQKQQMEAQLEMQKKQLDLQVREIDAQIKQMQLLKEQKELQEDRDMSKAEIKQLAAKTVREIMQGK